MITTVCKISYGSQTVPLIVPAVQGDTGRAISFEIADFTPPAGATATYFILKPSGEAIYNSATITNNSILCELTAQSLAEAGENRMQVRVLLGEDIVTSFEVILMVRTFLGDDAIESGTEMNIFDQAVEQAAEEFQTQAEQIVEEVIESIPSDYTALTEEVDELNERLSDVKDDLTQKGLSEETKVALLGCFEHVAWIDEHGQDYYDALHDALYPDTSLVRLEAVFTQGSAVIYPSTPLNELKAYLVVTGFYNDGTSRTITDYSLSGTLEVGTSIITVEKSSKTTTFNVIVSDVPWEYITRNVTPTSERQIFEIGNTDLLGGDIIEIAVHVPENSSSQTILRFGTNDTTDQIWAYGKGTKYLVYGTDKSISSYAVINNPNDVTSDDYLLRYVVDEPISIPSGSTDYHFVIDKNGYSLNGTRFEEFDGEQTTSNNFENYTQAKNRLSNLGTLYFGFGPSPSNVTTLEYIRILRNS